MVTSFSSAILQLLALSALSPLSPLIHSNAFVLPHNNNNQLKVHQRFQTHVHRRQHKQSLDLNLKLHALPPTPSMASLSLPSVDISIDASSLTQYFLETLISYGVPAFFWIVVIAFAAKAIKGARKDSRGSNSSGNGPNGNLFGTSSSNVINELYDDLYGSSTGGGGMMGAASPFAAFSPNNKNRIPPKNIGVPKTQYLKITKLNDRYSSYTYSLTAATQSKAKAAAQYRSKAFDSALQRAFDSSIGELNGAQKSDLLLEEKEFLNKGGEILDGITNLQIALTDLVIREEMDNMDVEIGEVDAHDDDDDDKKKEGIIDATIVGKETNSTTTSSITTSASTSSTSTKEESSKKKNKKKSGQVKKEINKLVKEIEKLNTDLLRLEMEFIRAVVEVMGPDRANGIRSALLGNIAGGGSGVAGGLLKSLQDRPLSQILNTIGYSATSSTTDTTDSHSAPPRNLFITDFPGDVSASQVDTLREEVTAILQIAKPGDEALLVLQTGGGTVTGYGLAAAQLQRFKKHGMKLTICVEQVAASGGYMMTCVADKVIASPFAVLGSIGVISDMPNVYDRLKKEGIEFQTVTAGKYKRTLTPTKKVTQEDVDKAKEEIEDILTLFKGFVKENRPSLDIDDVATGETWFGEDALKKGLCDEIRTVDDVLVEYVGNGSNVFEVKYDPDGFAASSPLTSLLPFGRDGSNLQLSDNNSGGIVQGAVRWLVRNIIPTIKDEITKELNDGITSSSTSKIRDRYMIRDPANSSQNIKVQD